MSTNSPNTQAHRSRGFYVFNYAGFSLRKHKTRTLSLLLGMVIGVALVASVFVWTDTGTRVAIDDYFKENLFQFSIQQRGESPPNPLRIYDIRNWVDNREETESSYLVHHSVGFLGISNMSNDDPYLPYPYSRGIKDAQVFFVEPAFLSRIQNEVEYTGSFSSLEYGECLMSERVVSDVETVLGITIDIGSVVDIAIAQQYNEPTLIGDLNRLNLTSIQVVGIYNFHPSSSVLFTAFNGVGRPNYPLSGEEVVFGWNDGIIFHHDQLPQGQLESQIANGLFPKLLVRLDAAVVFRNGLENVIHTIRRYQIQLEATFLGRVSIAGETQLIFLEEYIAAYQSRRTMGVLVTPVIVLSVFLTTFATNIFLSGRRAEVAILRARGASFRQLYAAFILEFFTVALIGQVLGMFLSLFIGSLLPASEGFLQFNFDIFFRFFTMVNLQPLTWLIAFLACIVPPLVFTMIYVRSFLRTEIYQAMVGINPPAESDIGTLIIYLIGCIALLVFFFIAVALLPSTPNVAILQFIYAVAIWILLSDSGSRVVRRGVAGITRAFRPLFGEKTAIFVKSMRTRRERIVPLLLILTLTFSITVFSVVEAQIVQDNAYRQIEYFIGADMRVESHWVPSSRANEIASITGIAQATPFVRTFGVIGTTSLYLIGIDVDAYTAIGHWDLTSMVGETPDIVLNRLRNDPNGIIIPYTLSAHLARTVGDRLGLFVYDQDGLLVQDTLFNIDGLGHSSPGFGYFDPDDPSRPLDITSGFQFQESMMYCFVHKGYLESLNITRTQLFLCSTNGEASIEQIEAQTWSLGFSTYVTSPQTFKLEETYPDGYLFNRGVVSILSIGFLACLGISMVALVLFVGVIVSERQTEYAIMRAVGGTRRQIITVVVGEFIGLILSSFIVSLLLGGAFSWLLMNVLLDLFPFPYVVPFPINPPFLLLLGVLTLVLIGMAIGTYIPARRAGRTNVGRVLRNL